MSLTHLIEAKEMHITEKPEIFCHIYLEVLNTFLYLTKYIELVPWRLHVHLLC